MISKSDIRILFMGTPHISAYVLEKMILNGFNIVGLVSQTDKPVGRKRILMPTPTKEIALKYNVPIFQKEKIRKDYEFVKEINPDLILAFAYGQILPEGLLAIPKYGCLNLHGSLLPKYRGAAPIQYSLINNDKETGVTLMEMTKEMDAGRMYAKKVVTIEEDDNSTSLFNKIAVAAFELVDECLLSYLNGELKGEEQDINQVTFCSMISKEDEHLDINKSVKDIYGYIRALSDAPGGYFNSSEGKIKIFKAKIVSYEVKGNLGEIIQADKSGILLQCKDGILSLLELQKEGKSRMDYKSFLNGNQNFKNTILN